MNNTISEVTNIPYENMTDIVRRCLLHDILNGIKEGETQFNVDLGIGTLTLRLDTYFPEFKFNPTQEFHNEIIDLTSESEDPLTMAAEEKINKIIEDFYKELL